MVTDTPARLIDPWYVGQSDAPAGAPDDAGVVGADDTDPGGVAAGDAGPDPVHADSARMTNAAAAAAGCRERMPASVPPDCRGLDTRGCP
jgi:hypothetical protein